MNMTTTKRRPRTGLNALKARVKVRGLAAIDRRTAAARALLAWQDEVVAALGGEENVSPQKRALVELTCRQKLYIDHLDGYIRLVLELAPNLLEHGLGARVDRVQHVGAVDGDAGDVVVELVGYAHARTPSSRSLAMPSVS